MRFAAVLCAAVATTLSACETMPEPGGPVTDNGNDCAVIAAVAREHYKFNTTDNVPLPLWLDDEHSGWAPKCDWPRYGVSFPRIYNPYARPVPGQLDQYVSFKRPRYDGHGALVETSILHGPLAGMGYECRVISGFAGWTVPEGSCRNTFVS